MKPYKKAIGLFIVITVIGVTLFEVLGSYPETSSTDTKMRGVNWVGGDSVVIQNFEPLHVNNVEWIIQTPFGWMDSHDSPEVIMADQNAYYWGESDRGIRHTARLSKEKGIKTILKPHIWMNPWKGKWRSDIQMESDSAWDVWFKSYENFILHYAKIAEENQLEGFCIGTELYHPCTKQDRRFRELIQKIRQVYSGKLVYAANWYKEFEEVKFWDELDMIGIQAYFPLTENTNPTLEELMENWGPYKDRIRKISETYDKPVVFTEVGYRSMSDAGIEPWQWPKRDEKSEMISYETQAICYEALFQTFWDEPWFDGAFIWKWYPHHDRLRETATRNGFTPQHKEAEEVIRRWYQRSSH